MDYNQKIEELLQVGESFDFAHNCKINENGEFCKPSPELLAWITEVQQFVIDGYGSGSAPAKLLSNFNKDDEFKYAWGEDAFVEQLGYLKGALLACKKIVPTNIAPVVDDSVSKIREIFEGFHKVAVRLQSRHGNRNSIEILDEYDVQDLLAALLRIKFDDVREEESCPSFAGAASRVDFLLKKERIVIETKMTRKGLSDKEIGAQLIEDITKYSVHPDCGRLMCFVYDKDERLQNPRGLISDLSRGKDFPVDVFVSPKR